jgi:hypothetical protein
MALAEMRPVCNLVKDQCVIEIARAGQNFEDPENDCRLTFWHALLRSWILRDSLVRHVQAGGEYFGR